MIHKINFVKTTGEILKQEIYSLQSVECKDFNTIILAILSFQR